MNIFYKLFLDMIKFLRQNRKRQMDVKEKFDRVFKKQGGRLPDQDMNAQLEFAFDGVRGTIDFANKETKANLKIYVDYIANESLNACATKVGNEYFIGICYGGIYVLGHLFLRMLSNPNVLKEFGDPSQERAKKIFNAQMTNVRDLFFAVQEGENFAPVDQRRRDIALLLFQFASNYLALHEYAHIALGHQDYKKSKTSETIYSELDNPIVGNAVTTLFQQCLELEADEFATNFSLHTLFNSPIVYGSASPRVVIEKDDNQSKLFLWCFAVYSFWRLFGMNVVTPEALKSRTHPSPAFRQHIILELTQKITEYNLQDEALLQKLPNIVRDSVLEVEKAFNEISEQPFDPNAYASVFNEEVENHYKILKTTTLNQVRPALNGFRHIYKEKYEH